MTKWEYKRTLKSSDLTDLGFEGWELVAISNNLGIEVFFLKREVATEPSKIIPGCEPVCEHVDSRMDFHSLFTEEGKMYGYCGTFEKEMTQSEIGDFIKRNGIKDSMIKKGIL